MCLSGKNIFGYKVRNGVNSVQLEEDGEFIEIGHANDLTKLGISVPDQANAS